VIKQELYLGEYDNVEDLEAAIQWYWSGSKMDKHGQCWRRGYHVYKEDLVPVSGDTHPLVAGGAVHAGLAYYYAHGGPKSTDPDLCERVLEVLREEVDKRGGLALLPPKHKYHHITTGHLEILFKYYFKYSAQHDSFAPIVVDPDDLDLSDVVGAKWWVTDSGRIVLGESAFLMRMQVEVPWSDKPEHYLYAGIPDLPVRLGGYDYVMDHKWTGGAIGTWWAYKWRADNTLRVYCAMLQKLLKTRDSYFRGVLLNAGTWAKTAATVKFKGTRFERFGPWDFEPGSIQEAMINHAAIIRMSDFCADQLGYFPQIPQQACANCDMLKLCVSAPEMRPATKFTEYKERDKGHLLRID
jgi:hypothetical protein